MDNEDQERMKEWARNNGKSVRQRTVRQETTKYKADTLPLNMYERKQPIGEKIQFAIPSAHDLDETQLDETCPNCAGDHDENQVDEYSDGSDSSDSEMTLMMKLRTTWPSWELLVLDEALLLIEAYSNQTTLCDRSGLGKR